MIKIGIMEGSLRRASFSRVIGRNAARLAPEGMAVSHLPSTDTMPHFNQDVMDKGTPDTVQVFGQAISELDGLLIVTPEYNWSVPGTLKNAIDWVSRLKPNPLEGMPVAIWSVNPGKLGGARLHESMRQILHSQGMLVMAKPEVQVAGVKGKIDIESDRITDAETEAFLSEHLKAFSDFCQKWQGQ